MPSPIDDIAFLTRSETRVDVLRAVEAESRTRRELAAVTETPKSTLGRTLGELEERGWIKRNGRMYESTTAGSLVVEQLVPFLSTITVLQKLGDAVELLPLDETELDVQHLADAKFVRPTEMVPTAPFDYGIEQLQETSRFRCIARTAPPRYVEAIHNGVVTRRFTAECVLGGTYLDDIGNDHGSKERWHEIADTSSTVRRYEEPISFVFLVLDETVHLWLCDGEGESQGLVESKDPDLLTWANTAVDRYLEQARPI
ncbi:MAG: helix-turn-helix transcriptional regulator [Halobacteriota archaeon]